MAAAYLVGRPAVPAAAQALVGALNILSSSAWLHRSYACAVGLTHTNEAQGSSNRAGGALLATALLPARQRSTLPGTGATLETIGRQAWQESDSQWRLMANAATASVDQPPSLRRNWEEQQQRQGSVQQQSMQPKETPQQQSQRQHRQLRRPQQEPVSQRTPQLYEPAAQSFAKLGIHAVLLPALARQHIQTPSPVQLAAMPLIMAGRNVALQSQTGSGKTLAYLLPLMSRLLCAAPGLTSGQWRQQLKGMQVLVVAPSQELCMQIMRVAQALLPAEARSAVQQCIGGANPRRQREALAEHKPLVVVGTPGRLAQLIKAGELKVAHVATLVLDEADQLLASELAHDMRTIHSSVGASLRMHGRQTLLVSASLRPSSLQHLSAWCPAPKLVTASAAAVHQTATTSPATANPQEQAQKGDAALAEAAAEDDGAVLQLSMSPQLRHFYIVSYAVHKVDTLRRCVHALGAERALVFMNWQQRLQDAQSKLDARGLEAGVLHGGLPKAARQGMLAAFAAGKLQLLVVSDMAARGLDVEGCDAVFNLEAPETALHYAHRAGRTGRMGAPGVVVSVVTRPEVPRLRAMGRRLGVDVQEAFVEHGQFMIREESHATKHAA